MKTRQSTQTNSIIRYSLLTITAAIVLTSCGGGESSEQVASNDSTSTAENTTVITAMQLARTDFSHYFTVQGLVEADQNAQLFPEAAGKITSISVKEGDKVSKGQTLMTIDSKIVTNQINELKSRLQLAKLVYEKQESLWSQEIGSEIQYLEAKNNYKALENNVETLEAQKSLYVVSAPFSGEVDEINPKVGEMANPAMPAFRLINMKSVYIKADVTEGYLGKIKAGDAVVAAFPSMGHEVETKIGRIGNFINPNNRTFKITLDLPNSDNILRPNLLAEISIRDYASDSTVVIPSALIQMTPTGQEFVYTVVDGVAKKVEITTGITYQSNVEITEGLIGTEMLIERGARSVKDGDKVAIQS
ncbi:efflux RND transporter periplasmic adaptor subunit [Salibacteraceae bacterium]|nr:efflux RND transporter periplasmic adaptor subunit [Salibacteraceae bacterium]